MADDCDWCETAYEHGFHECAKCGSNLTGDDTLGLDEYADRAQRTARGPTDASIGREHDDFEDRLTHLALAVNGEAGELAEKVKKYRREGDEQYLDDLVDECGDTLWYLLAIPKLLGVEPSDMAEQNLDKLADREERDVIHGEGDHR